MRLCNVSKPFGFLLLVVSICGGAVSVTAQDTARTLRGKVTDSGGEALIGANVLIRGRSEGVTTGLDGDYALPVVPGDVLEFSYLGYRTHEAAYTGQDELNVVLEPDATDLDAVVVVGYGTQRRRDVTGSIASVGAGQLATTVAASNPLQGLQGKVAGVEIVQNNAPGGAPQVRVRGVSSFTNSDPCYVVDGLIVDNISYINPNDVESMEVLKDASATAIYGSRGANGVIIITTKQGRKNQPVRVSVDANLSVSQMARYLPYADASQYLALQNRKVMAQNAIEGTSAELPYTAAQIAAAGKGTDWQREITRTALTQNYNVNVVGGGEKSTYGISAGYFDQQGIMKESGYERANVKVSGTYDLARWARLGSNISYIYEKRNSQGATLSSALRALPTAPVMDPDDPGRFFGPVNEIGKSGNPVASLFYDSDNFTNYYKTILNLFAELEPVEGLVFRSSFTLNSSNSEGKSFYPRYEVNSEQRRIDNELNIDQSRTTDWLNENTLTYSFEKNKHSFSVLGGITFQKISVQSQNQNIKGMPDAAWKNRNLWYTGLGKAATLTGGSSGTKYTYLSYLARANYNYDDRYLLTATLRVDGSSRFPRDGRYGTFPAVGAGWVLGEENFLKDVRWLDQLKIRASYGVVGSDAGIPDNIQTAYVNRVNGVFGLHPESVVTSEVLDMVIDYGLHWEEARQFDVGFDFRALRNRLSVEFDYYVKNTRDILTAVSLPGISGTSYSPLSNIATARNSGVELSVSWQDAKKDFSYGAGFVLTTLKNRVRSVNRNLPPLENGANVTLVGYPIGGFWGYEVLGIYQDGSAVEGSAHIAGAGPGDLWYKDQNGDGSIDKDDRIYMGSYLPKATLGFNGMVGYKGVELNFDLYASLGNKIYSARRQTPGSSPYNVTDEYMGSWIGPGSTNSTTRVLLEGGGANDRVSEYYVEDGSYFRIRNLALAYNLPERILGKAGIASLKVYFSINNLYTATRASGYSPEVSGSPNAAGIDNFDNVYPASRTYSFGINIAF